RGVPDQQRIHVSRCGPRDCLRDRRGRGGERGPHRRQHEGGESLGLRPVSSSEQRADGSRAVPASAALHEERAPLRRVPSHVDGNRRATVHRGRKRTTTTRGRRPGAGGLGGRPETEDAPRPVAGSPIDVSGPPSGMRPMRIIVCIKQVPTAYALSETIQKIGGYDLILTGEETTDASTGHVGPGIAGHLDLPQITYVSEVRIVDHTIRARRTAEDGTEWWQTDMPSLCTV